MSTHLCGRIRSSQPRRRRRRRGAVREGGAWFRRGSGKTSLVTEPLTFCLWFLLRIVARRVDVLPTGLGLVDWWLPRLAMKELAMKERMPSRGEKRMMTTNVIHLEKPPLPHAIIKKLSCRLTQAYMVPPQSYWYCSTLPLSPTPLGKFKNKNFEATPDPLTTLLLLTKPQNDPAHLPTQACTTRTGLKQMVKTPKCLFLTHTLMADYTLVSLQKKGLPLPHPHQHQGQRLCEISMLQTPPS